MNSKVPLRVSTIVVLCGLSLGLLACQRTQHSDSASAQNSQTATAALQSSVTHLYYSGTLQPLRSVTVTSPVDGVIEQIAFHAGDRVKQGQLLLLIHSDKSQQDYAQAITNYLKDKDQYLRNRMEFAGTEALYHAQIVAKEDYLSAKSQLQANELSYLNSTQALRTLLQKIPGAPQNIESLSLNDIPRLKRLLAASVADVKVTAPTTGITLTPAKAQDSGDSSSDASDALSVGKSVKETDTLLNIGDMSGVTTQIAVAETDINAIKIGQSAVITSAALPGIWLYGKVIAISQQAKSSQGAVTFTVGIAAPNLDALQQSLIKVGMTSKVDISVSQPPQIKIPINAVVLKNGVATVTLIDKKSGKSRVVEVETGLTDQEQVVILKGLQAGDQVKVYDSALTNQ